MVTIIRMRAQEKKTELWDNILSLKSSLQAGLQGKGQMLYLSMRAKQQDVSLFVHTADPNILGDFVSGHLGRIEDVVSIWVINMIKPIFFPLPKETGDMKRFAVTVKAFPKKLVEAYDGLANMAWPPGIKMVYIAFTFHLFEDSIQFSVLADREETLSGHLANAVAKMPGVLRTTVGAIERTKPLVSYDEWKEYFSRHSIVPAWDEKHMVGRFQSGAWAAIAAPWGQVFICHLLVKTKWRRAWSKSTQQTVCEFVAASASSQYKSR
ncbi:MAG: hypothetical protein HY747_03530 [Elusimicrobia bacterium]|nr:hypothetical protein [Elusimicrobiota bacterium]